MSGFPLALENGEVRVFRVRQFKILSKIRKKRVNFGSVREKCISKYKIYFTWQVWRWSFLYMYFLKINSTLRKKVSILRNHLEKIVIFHLFPFSFSLFDGLIWTNKTLYFCFWAGEKVSEKYQRCWKNQVFSWEEKKWEP